METLMAYAHYRISRGSAPRRLIGLCAGVLVPLVAVIALDQGLHLNLADRVMDIAVVTVAPPVQTKVTPPAPIPNTGTYDPGTAEIPPPQINVDNQGGAPSIMASEGSATGAQFRASNSLPLYPESAKRNCEQGTVALNLRIGGDGRVADASVARSSGYPALDDAALRAARNWRFTPARQNGSAVGTTIVQPVKFDLRNEIGVSMTAAEVRACLKD